MLFRKGGKTFKFLQAGGVTKVNSGLDDLHRSFQSGRVSIWRQIVSLRLNSPCIWENNPQQGALTQFPAHSLSQRGMDWCHVPSAWQTAVKDSSFWLPCMEEKKKKKALLDVQSLIFPSPHRYIILSVHLSIAVQQFPCSTPFQLLASPFAAFPASCVCHRLQIIHSKPRYKQPATIKTWQVCGVTQPWH